MAVSKECGRGGVIPERIDHEAITHLLQRIPTIYRRTVPGATAGHVQTAGIGCAPAGRHAPGTGL